MAEQWYAPFSPQIMKDHMPAPLLAELRAATDALLSDPDLCERHAERSPVLYDVNRRVEMPETLLPAHSPVMVWLQEAVTRYVHKVHADLDPEGRMPGMDPSRVRAFIIVAWVNSARAGDFVPAHKHSCDISGAVYIDVPNGMLGPSGLGGQLTFFDGRPNELVREKMSFTPASGEVLVFPGWLSHAVHPFRCEGERRMLSFNAVIAVMADPEDAPSEGVEP